MQPTFFLSFVFVALGHAAVITLSGPQGPEGVAPVPFTAPGSPVLAPGSAVGPPPLAQGAAAVPVSAPVRSVQSLAVATPSRALPSSSLPTRPLPVLDASAVPVSAPVRNTQSLAVATPSQVLPSSSLPARPPPVLDAADVPVSAPKRLPSFSVRTTQPLAVATPSQALPSSSLPAPSRPVLNTADVLVSAPKRLSSFSVRTSQPLVVASPAPTPPFSPPLAAPRPTLANGAAAAGNLGAQLVAPSNTIAPITPTVQGLPTSNLENPGCKPYPCNLFYQYVQIYYWPPKSPQPCAHRPSIDAQKPPANFAMKSPSIYAVFPSIEAKDGCRTIGSTFKSITTSFAPGGLSTLELVNGKEQTKLFNPADLACPPARLGLAPGQDYQPLIAPPAFISKLDPEFAGCIPALSQGVDPPTAIETVDNAAGPSDEIHARRNRLPLAARLARPTAGPA